MDNHSWSPLLSGLIGGVLALWITSKWAKWVPIKEGTKDAATLASENWWRTLGANVFFFGGILVGIFLFSTGFFARTDWRAGGLIFGSACVTSVTFLYLSAAPLGQSRVREAFTAYAISQRMPLPLLVAVWSLGLLSFLYSTFRFATD